MNALKVKGHTYYSFLSEGSGVISKYEMVDHSVVYPLKNDRGSIHKISIKVKNQRIAVYTAHLDYTNYASYLPRGYDGLNWKKLPEPITDTMLIKKMNLASFREAAIRAFIMDAKKEISDGSIIFLGGDFNEPSHLDWIIETKDMFDRKGVHYQWDLSTLLYNAGFKDSYREMYPSSFTHPGFTFPSYNRDAKISSLTWTPEADERERIDFIYFYPDKKLKLKSSQILGPDSSIVYSMSKIETSQDTFIIPLDVWPTDHKAVIATFILHQ